MLHPPLRNKVLLGDLDKGNQCLIALTISGGGYGMLNYVVVSNMFYFQPEKLGEVIQKDVCEHIFFHMGWLHPPTRVSRQFSGEFFLANLRSISNQRLPNFSTDLSPLLKGRCIQDPFGWPA